QSSTKFVGHKGKIIRFPLWVGNIFVVKRLSEEEGYYLYPRNRQLDVASLIVWANRIWVKRTDEETILNGLRLGMDIWPPEKKIIIQGDDQFKAMVRNVVEKHGFGFYFISDSEMRFMSRKEPEPEQEKSKPMSESAQERPEPRRPRPR
ncbi:MAG: hypothetical protein LBP67_04020, partial [Bacteroidales bacterium]|nr:hypothetical protein [Bacteroidales bacterium]